MIKQLFQALCNKENLTTLPTVDKLLKLFECAKSIEITQSNRALFALNVSALL